MSAIVAMCALSENAYSSATHRAIGIDPEPSKVEIYAVGQQSNAGVYTLPVGETFSCDKISGSTYIQYYFSGGTFVSKETVYGTSDTGWSIYAGKATAEGGVDGPWSHTAWNYRDADFQSYTWEIVSFDMTYDEISGKIYGSFRGDEYGISSRLCIYDGENITITPVGNFSDMITAIAADPSGKLYGIAGYYGNLYSIDKTNGQLSLIGSLGVTANGANQSAAIDPVSGKLYWGATTSFSASLYEVDLETCSATKLYDFPYGQRFNAFYIPEPDAPQGAPAAVENLSVTPVGEGTDVSVSFTMPSTTVGGETISEELDYVIEIDGESIEGGEGKAVPGEDVSSRLTLSNGSHTVSVSCLNTAGKGPKSSAAVFAGFDIPGSVSDINISAEDNHITISWNAPTGKNGGAIDYSKITYTITRNPGAAEVAADLTETSATDDIPEAPIAEYTYTITVNYDGVPGESMESGSIMVGKPYTIPYKQDFENAVSFSDIAFKAIDKDKNTESWQIAEADGNKFAQIKAGFYTNRNDYLFAAPVMFTGEKKYILKFKLSNSSNYYGTNIRIFLSRTQNDNEEDFIEPFISSNFQQEGSAENMGKFITHEIEFEVKDSGIYCLCFHDMGYYFTNNDICIDDIEIIENGNVGIDASRVDDGISLTAADGMLTVYGSESMRISVYSTDGRLISVSDSHGETFSAQIAPGLYIVNVGTHTYKIKL